MKLNFCSIALGANLPSPAGAPRATLDAALAALAPEMRVVARSPWYATPAFPPGAGPDFVNGAATIETALAPAAALARLHEIERALGRDRRRRWAPRACDLDLLFCGQDVLPDRATVETWMALDPARQATEAPTGPILPHPRLHERGFVLLTLADVAPDWRHPILGATVAEMLAALPPEALEGVRRI